MALYLLLPRRGLLKPWQGAVPWMVPMWRGHPKSAVQCLIIKLSAKLMLAPFIIVLDESSSGWNVHSAFHHQSLESFLLPFSKL